MISTAGKARARLRPVQGRLSPLGGLSPWRMKKIRMAVGFWKWLF